MKINVNYNYDYVIAWPWFTDKQDTVLNTHR